MTTCRLSNRKLKTISSINMNLETSKDKTNISIHHFPIRTKIVEIKSNRVSKDSINP